MFRYVAAALIAMAVPARANDVCLRAKPLIANLALAGDPRLTWNPDSVARDVRAACPSGSQIEIDYLHLSGPLVADLCDLSKGTVQFRIEGGEALVCTLKPDATAAR
jgi:hypothetical protein